MSIQLTGWKEHFAPKILRRGEDYFYSGAVQSLHWDGETITAAVGGTEDYKVKITVSGGRIKAMDCSCPYAETDNCKHMAAVLFAASQDSFPGEAEETGGASGPGKTAEMPLDKAVRSLSAAAARELLLIYARKHADLAEQVMLKAAGSVTRQQIQAWNRKIISLTVHYSDHGFIDYRSAGAYTRELKTLLREKVPILLECGLPMEAFQLTCKALQEASDIAMDDSGGELGGLYYDCVKLWQNILPRMSREQRHKMFDWFQENYTRWSVADDIFDDFMFGTSKQDAAFTEPEFLRRKLKLLDEQIPKAAKKKFDYQLNHFVLRRVETMEKLAMDRTEIEAYLREHKQLRSIRTHLIDAAVREARYDDAVSLLRESKEIDAEYPGCVSEYSGRLVELYRTLDRVEDLRAELLFQMEEVRQDDLKYVNLLKEITPEAQWPDLREHLLSKGKQINIRGRLLEQEGLFDRLLDYVRKSNNPYTMDRFVDTLEERYPAEVLEFYTACLRSDMMRAGNRSEYAEQAKRLKAVAGLQGGQEAAAGLIHEWMGAYPRRRAMFEELRKAGF